MDPEALHDLTLDAYESQTVDEWEEIEQKDL